MHRLDLGRLLDRAIPTEPVVAVLVPEADLLNLALAAREAVFEIDETILPAAQRSVHRELDRASEPFADMFGADLDTMREDRRELRVSADRVRAWLDAECITLPPVHHIRALVEAFL